MTPTVEKRGAKRKKRPVMHVRVSELWRDVARLLRTAAVKLFSTAFPFGMASIGVEQSLLGLFPQQIRDQRAAAILAFYGSMVIAYLAYAAMTIVVMRQWAKGTGSWVQVVPLRGKHLVSVVTIALVAPLGTIAGLAAALIPGIIVWLSWILAAPLAASAGETAFQAMRRSARLTWGSRRSLFYAFATVQLSALVMSCISAAAMGQPVWAPLDDPKPLTALETVIGGLVETLQLAVNGAICCVAFARLRTAELQADAAGQSR